MPVDNPKVSVIVPVYKVEPYLRQCLDSIVNQTYQNLEIILVEDGSPDNCGAICDEYVAKDKRIQVIHKENGGVSSARNAGLAAATGEYIGWVDSDDWIEADMFEYLLKGADKFGADIAVCGRYEVCKGKKKLRGWGETMCLDRLEGLKLLLQNDLMQNFLWDKLWRQELFQGIAFPEGKTFEDIAVMYRLFERAEKVVCLPDAKYNYFQRSGSIVSDTTLENRLNHYWAAKGRYEDMKGRWPELEDLLLAQCAASAIGIWCGYYKNPRWVRNGARLRLEEIAKFCAAHVKRAGKCIGVGLAGKIALMLIPHVSWWSFALAWCVGRLYKKKHGRSL